MDQKWGTGGSCYCLETLDIINPNGMSMISDCPIRCSEILDRLHKIYHQWGITGVSLAVLRVHMRLPWTFKPTREPLSKRMIQDDEVLTDL